MKDIDLNTSPMLPESSGSTEGASGGSLGDASMADLKQGYHKLEDSIAPPVLNSMMPESGGFLNRPHGWER